MDEASRKLKLGENHRRVISVVLRNLERMCDEIEEWLDRQPGLLFRVQDDLSAGERASLRRLAAAVRTELARITGEVDLDRAPQSPRGAVIALLSANIVNLEETNSERLAGYGSIPEEARHKLDGEMSRLLALLEKAAGQFARP